MTANNSELDIVAIVASASGVEALKDVVPGLPPDLSSAILIVQKPSRR